MVVGRNLGEVGRNRAWSLNRGRRLGGPKAAGMARNALAEDAARAPTDVRGVELQPRSA